MELTPTNTTNKPLGCFRAARTAFFFAIGVASIAFASGQESGQLHQSITEIVPDVPAYTVHKRQLARTAKFAGNNGKPSSAFPLQKCEADCDSDDDCDNNLVCFQRDDDESVNGCKGLDSDFDGKDVCHNPDDSSDESESSSSDGSSDESSDDGRYELEEAGNNGSPSSAFPLKKCEGDCDDDDDCGGSHLCWQRDSSSDPAPPGCNGSPKDDIDYCYDPDDEAPDVSGRVSVSGSDREPTNDIGRYSVILKSGDDFIRPASVSSPNGQFTFELTRSGDMKLLNRQDDVLWEIDGDNGYRLYMQDDGHLILRTRNKDSTWRSRTNEVAGASFVLNDVGQLAVISRKEEAIVWLGGVPQGVYSSRDRRSSLRLPIRGAFYYPWFPETWEDSRGNPVFYEPSLGYYDQSDPDILDAHLDAFEYAHIELGILSWFGQGSHLDPARLTSLLIKSRGTDIHWTVYYEDEKDDDPSPSDLEDDLEYLKKWFVWHENWAHIDGKPVIFVYNDGSCNVSRRWEDAARDWYVVLKKFGDYEGCRVQPDHWHQYGPAFATASVPGHAFSISPGFWNAGKREPRLERLSRSEWKDVVEEMVDSDEPLQLITTFNEWGEGTSVESARDWDSSSGYGFYMDVLHDIH